MKTGQARKATPRVQCAGIVSRRAMPLQVMLLKRARHWACRRRISTVRGPTAVGKVMLQPFDSAT